MCLHQVMHKEKDWLNSVAFGGGCVNNASWHLTNHIYPLVAGVSAVADNIMANILLIHSAIKKQ